MNWLKNAASQASQRLEATLQESGVSQRLAGVSEKLAPVTSVALETKSLFSSLTSTLEKSFNKASESESEVSADNPTNSEVGPPWITTHTSLKPFEADIKVSILKITEGEKEDILRRLQERPADESFEFDWLVQRNTSRAMAALEADPNLQEARHRLVPGVMKEDVFWRNYFYKCDLVVSSFLKMSSRGLSLSAESSAIRSSTPSNLAPPSAKSSSTPPVSSTHTADSTTKISVATPSSAAAAASPAEAAATETAAAVRAVPAASPSSPETALLEASGGSSTPVQVSLDAGLSWEEEMAAELAGIRAEGGSDAGAAGAADGDAGELVLDDDDFEKELGL